MVSTKLLCEQTIPEHPMQVVAHAINPSVENTINTQAPIPTPPMSHVAPVTSPSAAPMTPSICQR